MQRRLTIRSNPPGAFVYVDNYPIGTTPVATDFVYYGKRQIRLVRDGYETLTIDKKIRAPWYEWFGIDFISENLIPYNIRDEQSLDFQMVPQQIPPSPQLTARAEELRASSQAQRYVAPVPVPPPLPPGVQPGLQPPPPGAPPPQFMAPPPGTRIPPPGTTQPTYLMPPLAPSAGAAAPAPGWQPAAGSAPPPEFQAPNPSDVQLLPPTR